MGLYEHVKQAVPLEWKAAFHRGASWSRHLHVRVGNRLQGRPPLPPADLIFLVIGEEDPRAFLESGRRLSQNIGAVVARHGLRMEGFRSVLDFGCGVGRIMRHWDRIQGPAWHGTDYNPRLVAWCARHLRFARFSVNTLSGPLPYQAEAFDFIYAFSVFTHLSDDLQAFWMREVYRVLAPGGYLYFTTHGDYYVPMLSPAERTRFEEGRPVIRAAEQSGSNSCAVFHPPRYVQDTLARDFGILDFIPGSDAGTTRQDIHFARKPPR